MNWYMLLLDACAVIVAVALWSITRAYLEHRAYVRMFDGHQRPPFSLRCWFGWHKDKVIGMHNGFNLTRCERCERPSMQWAPPAL